jgi:transposase
MKKATRRKFTPEFKAKVAIEALKEKSTLSELSEKFEISPVIISRWKKEFIINASAAFTEGSFSEEKYQKEKDALHAKIGELEMKLDFAKRVSKKLGIPMPAED